MLAIGTEVTMNHTIMGEMDRKRSHFIFQRIIDQVLIGKVESYQGDKLWVRWPGVAVLVQEHNVNKVEIYYD